MIVLLSVCLMSSMPVFWSWHSKYCAYHVKPPPPFLQKSRLFPFFVSAGGGGYFFWGMGVLVNRKLGVFSFSLFLENTQSPLNCSKYGGFASFSFWSSKYLQNSFKLLNFTRKILACSNNKKIFFYFFNNQEKSQTQRKFFGFCGFWWFFPSKPLSTRLYNSVLIIWIGSIFDSSNTEKKNSSPVAQAKEISLLDKTHEIFGFLGVFPPNFQNNYTFVFKLLFSNERSIL